MSEALSEMPILNEINCPWPYDAVREGLKGSIIDTLDLPLSVLHGWIEGRTLELMRVDHRLNSAHLTGDGKCGTNPLDAVACWFLLLMLNDRDLGVRPHARTPKDLRAIDTASRLLGRWLEGDCPETAEWEALLPDPQNSDHRGQLSSAGYAAAGIARLFLRKDFACVLKAAGEAMQTATPPAEYARPVRPFLWTWIKSSLLGVFLSPFWVVAWFLRRAEVRADSRCLRVMSRLFHRIARLPWITTDERLRELFARVLSGETALMPECEQRMREVYLEPDDIEIAKEVLPRMVEAGRKAGLSLIDRNYVTGLVRHRRYDLRTGPPPVPLASREFYDDYQYYEFAYRVAGRWLTAVEDVKELSGPEAWKAFERECEDHFDVIEPEQSLSRRFFLTSGDPDRFWGIELERHDWTEETRATDDAPASKTMETRHRIHEISGPSRFSKDFWDYPADIRQVWREFPTRAVALRWYRREVQRRLEAGWTEIMPRSSYYSMKSCHQVEDEGKLIWDSECPPETPEGQWIQAQTRTALVPVFEDREGSPTDSKVRGAVAGPAGSAWPLCGACQSPLTLVVQLNLSQVPAEAPCSGPSLLQVFACSEDSCSGNRKPFDKTQVSRLLDLAECAATLVPPGFQGKEQVIAGWKPVPDYPGENDYYTLKFPDPAADRLWGVHREGAIATRFPTVAGEKLGGWPRWIEYANSAPCPECRQPMRPIYHADCSRYLMFAPREGATDHILQCETHPQVITLLPE